MIRENKGLGSLESKSSVLENQQGLFATSIILNSDKVLENKLWCWNILSRHNREILKSIFLESQNTPRPFKACIIFINFPMRILIN